MTRYPCFSSVERSFASCLVCFKKRRLSVFLAVVLALPCLPSVATAVVISGGIKSAIDKAGNSVDPMITTTTINGVEINRFSTGTFADGPFVSNLQIGLDSADLTAIHQLLRFAFSDAETSSGPFISTQEYQFTVSEEEPILSFNFSDFEISPDVTGVGAGPFFDSFFVSLWDGANSRTLLSVDRRGAVADAFGNSGVPIALGTPDVGASELGRSLSVDLSSEVGQAFSLSFDMVSEDDAWSSAINIEQPFLTEPDPERIPEPSNVTLLLIALSLAILKRRRA